MQNKIETNLQTTYIYILLILIINVAAFFVHGGTQIALLLWIPKPDPVIIYYILAALWGIGDAVIQTQINGMLSSLKIMYLYFPQSLE